MAVAVRAETNDQGEIFGRNQAIQCLKRRLKKHGIRIDMAAVFENRQSYELLAIYFTQVEAEDGSQKYLFTPKPAFAELVSDQSLLSHFRLLLPKPPSEVRIELAPAEAGETVPC